MREIEIYCFANSRNCPYYKNGECRLENSLWYCDDLGAYWCKDDNYYRDDEKGTVFEE